MDFRDIKELSFEQALEELDIIIKRLEEGKMPLEDAVRAFERGTELKKACEAMLDSAQLKIDMIDGAAEAKA